MHVQTNERRLVRHERDETDIERDSQVTTLQDLGRYLRKLREARRVTQASLSTKAGAMAGRKISRSRISEIENAKRDPVSERELRVYMVGLKCTPHHVDGMIKALRQCTVTPPGESPAGLVPVSSAVPDPSPAGLDGAEDDLTLRKEKLEDDLTTAGHEEEGRERWPQDYRHIHLLDASQPQPSRRRWQRHRIAFAAATALVVVALTWLGAEFFLRQESVDLPPSPGGPASLSVPPNVPLGLEGTHDFITNAASPDSALARVNKRSTQTSKIHDRPGPGDATSRDTTEKYLVGHCCFHKGQDQAGGVAVFRRVKNNWHRYAAESGGGWRPDLDSEKMTEGTER